MAEGSDDAQERTEEPTEKRLREAREKGQVARSKELGTLTVVMAGVASIFIFGPWIVERILMLAHSVFSVTREDIFSPDVMLRHFSEMMYGVLGVLSPLFIVVVIAAVVGATLLGGFSMSANNMAFKWEKFDVLKGIARIFSAKALMELFKALAKFLVIACIGFLLIRWQLPHFVSLTHYDIQTGVSEGISVLMWCLLALASGLGIIAAIDAPFQLWQHNKQMKMTFQEIKDEYKETEGRPEVKSKVRERQQAISRQRMMQAVPHADVVITNPTHFAVALRYKREKDLAPILVAKGGDLIAQKIREIAEFHHVPIVTAPPLARSIFHSTELEQPVPAGLYTAVAQVLAYVYQLKHYKRRGGRRPHLPDDLPIPEEFKPYL